MSNCLVGSLNGHGFGSWRFVSKPHLLLKVNLSLLVRLLPVFKLPVPFVDEMVASGDVVMPVVFDAFGSILFIKIELHYDLIE